MLVFHKTTTHLAEFLKFVDRHQYRLLTLRHLGAMTINISIVIYVIFLMFSSSILEIIKWD